MRAPRPAFAALAVSLSSTVALAEPAPPTSTTYEYSPYERAAIATEVESRGAIDRAPEGKLVEGIDVVSLEVIEPRDPAPGVLNALHVTSRRNVIERELLLHAGDRYVGVLADETARNLRQLPQLSLIAVVPIVGSAPDRVRLVVLTKDVWSLRLSWDVQYTPGGLQRLVLQPTETNLLGTHQSVALRYEYAPESNLFGARYVIPRLWQSHVQLATEANVVVNRRTGHPEGTTGGVALGQPLWSTLTEWAWSTSATWRNEISRRYVNAHVGTFDAIATPAVDGIPYEYRSRVYTADASITRSFGWAEKHDLTFGAQASYRAYETLDLSAYNPIAVDEFVRRKLPTSDTRIGPYLEGHEYTTSFLRLLDVETLGLQEDFRLGHDLRARVYPVSTAFGASRSYFGVDAGAQYTVPIGDGFVRANVRSITESESSRLADGSLSAALRIVSPRFGFGRLVFDASALNRYQNFLNRTSFLGGDSGLRGYPTSYLSGKDVVTENVELRTRALEIKTVLVGAVAFYDVGGAFDGFARLATYQAAGGGLRVLFPQLDRLVFRIDVGVPLASAGLPPGVSPFQYFVAFGQAFPVPSIAQ